MYTPVYYIHYVPLPTCVNGATVPNDDGTFDVYINAVLPEERQWEALRHEVKHLTSDHLYDDISPVKKLEQDASEKLTADKTIPLITVSA